MSDILSGGKSRVLSSSASTAALAGAGQALPIEAMLARAVRLHQEGNLDEAKAGYGDVLSRQPKNADALQFLGVLSHQMNDSKKAIVLLSKALKIDPKNFSCHNNIGSVYHETGNYKKAEFHFRRALKGAEVSAEAWSNLGLLQRHGGEFEAAIESFTKASEINSDYPVPYKEIGGIQLERRRFAEAEAAYRKYLALVPDDMTIGNNLGYVVQQQGRLDEAEVLFAEALERAGQSPELGYNMRALLTSQGRGDEAREMFREQIREHPELWTAEVGLAVGLARRGVYEEALQNMKDILEIFPEDAAVWNDIGMMLISLNKSADALEILQKATEIDPKMAIAQNNLGSAYIHVHNFEASVRHLKQAVALEPDLIDPYLNLCRALRGLADFDQANLFGRAAIALDSFEKKHFPNIVQVFRSTVDFESLEAIGDPWENAAALQKSVLPSVFLDLLVFSATEADHQKFFNLVRSWAEFVECEAARALLPAREREMSKGKLRVGFLSSDLRRHSVSRFLIPLMRTYDHDRFEFYCYSPVVAVGDPIQILIQDNVDKFTFVENMTHWEIARTIHDDDVDILLELNGFTHGSMIEVMAYKPAAVQMSWLGYPFTCGLKAIDHVLLDRHVVGPEGEKFLVEEPVHMPEAWVCFGKFTDVPIQAGLPMDRNGVTTFGTLNSVYKYTPEMIANWAAIMKRVPESRFLVVRPELGSIVVCKNISDQFATNGIGPERLFFFNNRTERKNHLSYYNEIDVSLDTFPLTGGTTTCEALWMGVPVVSLVGPAFHQRISYSALMHCGLEELCTFDDATFVDRAVEIANDPDRLLLWRQGLRDIVGLSPLCDEERFVYQFQEMLEMVAQHHNLR